MDETAVRKYSQPKPGLVSLSPKLRRARQRGVHVHPAGRGQQLAAFSHVAFVCDNTEIQASLPQVFIGNEHVLPVHVQQRVQPQLHRNVKLWRRKSSWVDGPALMEILIMLSNALQPFASRFQPVLIWDAAKQHLRADVLRCAGKLGIWVIIVPARGTWLLQPADTHCFARYKAYLRKKYLAASAAADDGQVSTEETLLMMNAAVREVFQKQKWRNSFVGNGFGKRQLQLRPKILEHLKWQAAPQVACTLPELHQFTHIWPRRLQVPIDELFYAFLPHAAPPARQPSHTSITTADEGPVSWIRRLRPRRNRESEGQDSLGPSAAQPGPAALHPAASGEPCLPIPRRPPQRMRPGIIRPRPIPRCRR